MTPPWAFTDGMGLARRRAVGAGHARPGGAGTPPYGCNSHKRGRGGIYATREFMRDAVRRLLFFFQHGVGHTVENVSSLPGMDV